MSGYDAGIGVSFIAGLVFYPKCILGLWGYGIAAVGNDLAQGYDALGPVVVRVVPCFGAGHVSGAAGDHLFCSLVARGAAAPDDRERYAAAAAVEAGRWLAVHKTGPSVYKRRFA